MSYLDNLPEAVEARKAIGELITAKLRAMGPLYKPILGYPPNQALEMTLELYKTKEKLS